MTRFVRELVTYLFSLVQFYGISTIVGYLMPNLVCSYISDIWFVNISQQS